MATPKSMISSRVMLGVSAALLLVGIVAGSVAVANSRISSHSQSNQQLIDSVQNSPNFALLIDSSEAPPMGIQSANSKEIMGDVYQQLTGLSANSSKYITLPSVSATNNSGKTITAVIIALEDNRSSEHILFQYQHALSSKNTQARLFRAFDQSFLGDRCSI